jgi:hypothetical protein
MSSFNQRKKDSWEQNELQSFILAQEEVFLKAPAQLSM